jgi:hypothetical protein
LCSRECILRIILSETFDDLDPWHAFIGAEFDDMALPNFHNCKTFCPMNPFLACQIRPVTGFDGCPFHTHKPWIY